jgi:cysteine-rich repeat protein
LYLAPIASLGFACGSNEAGEMVVDESIAGIVAAGTNAAFVSHNVPASMFPGETRTFEVQVQNTGTVLWDNRDYQLRRPVLDGLVYNLQQIFNRQVAAGEIVTFSFNVTAPIVEGPYNFDARMYVGRRIGGGFFGDTLQVPVNVSSQSVADYDANLISHDAPTALTVNEQRVVNIVMENTGLLPWLTTVVELRPKGAIRSSRSRPLSTISQGGTTNLPTMMTAPAAIGRYAYQMRMARQDGARWIEYGDAFEVMVDVGTVDSAITSANTPADSATFEFGSTPVGGTFECSLDGAPFVACFSPHNYTGLVAQQHTFEVRAVINGLADSTPASSVWTSSAPNNATPGDGVIGDGEECDDLNVANGDGCSSVSEIEGGYSCIGQPSACQLSTAVFSACDDGFVEMQLGFGFQFFASQAPVTSVFVGTNGRIFFSNQGTIPMTRWTNTTFPTANGNDFIAWWWDDLYFCDAPAAFAFNVVGSAPNRVARMIFSDVGLYPGRNPAAVLQAEVRLLEATNTIEVDYGTNTIGVLSGSIGIENAAGVVTLNNPLACNPTCPSGSWPVGTTSVYPQQP